MMRMFISSLNVERMSKHRYGLRKEVNHKDFGDCYKEVCGFIWVAPKEFDFGHLLM